MYIGKVYQNKEGCDFKVLAYSGNKMTVEWQDSYRHQMMVDANKALKGAILNPYHPTAYGVGFVGVGDFSKSKDGTSSRAYITWRGMLQRCYHEKTRRKLPTYEQCTVDVIWHNFQNFAKWFYEQYRTSWELDKDLLVKGNKLYGPDTCLMLPQEINLSLTKREASRGPSLIGVTYNTKTEKYIAQASNIHLGTFNSEVDAFLCYKDYKEGRLQKLAQLYKGKIPDEAFLALVNYQVEQGD